MKICHIADIHIRSISRHDEYRTVFQNLIDDLKKDPVDAIFVGGDVWHTKTAGLTPEYIDFMRWWLTELANCAELFVTLGNHDGNLVNTDRQDAVSPIVAALANPRVKLYKKSGVYEFKKGWNFCVYSLFDREGWKNVSPEKGKINIACYHGGVRSSLTETGWPIEEGPSVDFFDGYDLVLLGDIHRQQFLGSTKNGQPWIAYPGTPVCQNYAEGYQKHGYLKWVLNDDGVVNSVDFIELKQPNPFVTVDWEGDREKFVKDIEELPEGARFRVKSSVFVSQDDMGVISATLKKKKSAIEVVLKSEVTHKKDVFSAGGLEMMRDDLRNVEVLTLLLKDFYRGISISDSEWDDVTKLVEKYLRSASSDDESPRHVKWRIGEFSFENLYSYGLGNKINFDKLSGIVGIFGPNRSGKSSIVGTMMYGLFNTSDRGAVKNLQIVNDRKSSGEAKIVLQVGEAKYMLTRETNKTDTKKGVTVAATSLDLRRIATDGSLVNMNGEQRNDTEKTIRKLIGTQDDFLLTSMSTQGDLNKFINEGSAFRKLILTKFLDLDIFEKMHEAAKAELKAATAISKTIPKRDWPTELKKIDTKLSDFDDFADKIETKLSELRASLHTAQVKLALYKNTSTVSEDEISAAVALLESYVASSEALEVQLKKLRLSLENSRDAHARVLSLLENYDAEQLRIERDNGVALKSAAKTLEAQLTRAKEDVERLKRSAKKLSVVPCEDKFPTCMFIKDSHIDRGELPAAEENVAELERSLESTNSAFSDWQKLDTEKKFAEHARLLTEERALANAISASEMSFTKSESQLSIANAKRGSQKIKVDELVEAAARAESVEALTLQRECDSINEEIKRYDKMKVDAATRRGKFETEAKQLKSQQSQYEKVQHDIHVTELISEAFSKRGIPTKIINSQLPAINATIAEILHGVVDYTIEFVADEDSNALDVILNYGDSKRVIELGSGMEKLFASLAIRVALHTITSLPKTDMFVIDEGFGSLDDLNVEPCNRLLRSLKRYFGTVIVITHVGGIKDSADTIIEIARDGKDSKVVAE